MAFDSDVALLGTGVAPLVAASRLLAEGKSVLVLNPEWDFFGEDSELPLDPLWPADSATLNAQRLARSLPERALEVLSPDFPGALELWPPAGAAAGAAAYHDVNAPHLRARARLWVQPGAGEDDGPRWEAVEAMYVESSDAGLNPQILEGPMALKRFPGFSGRPASPDGDAAPEPRGVLIPKLGDVDVIRYRHGLLEFVRERLGADRVVSNALQVDLIPEGVRFHAQGVPRTARLREGLLVFWTPRLTAWVLAQAKRAEAVPVLPKGVRIWEQWSLVSREALDPGIVGMFEDLAVWADVEGAPAAGAPDRLAVLRAGPLAPLEGAAAADAGASWASPDSFRAVSRLCHGFLRWERFSVRSMRPRAIFEWERPPEQASWTISAAARRARVVAGCDGPLVEVVRAARAACEAGLA